MKRGRRKPKGKTMRKDEGEERDEETMKNGQEEDDDEGRK